MCSLRQHQKALLLKKYADIQFDLLKDNIAIAKDGSGYFLAVLSTDFKIISKHYASKSCVLATFQYYLKTGKLEVPLLKKGLKIKKKVKPKPFVMNKEVYDNWFLY